MEKSDYIIYGYLLFLGVCSVIYGFIVITHGDIHVPALKVNVVLPPTITQNATALVLLPHQLGQLQNISLNGIVIDVWWGLVEQNPREYNWTIYQNLFNTVQSNLPRAKVKANLHFHACHDNTSCDFNVPLPEWVSVLAAENQYEIFYTDANGRWSPEYLTSGIDHMPILYNRTAVQVYTDFIQNFANTFQQQYFDTLIYEISIGLGPEGELRYPAFSAPSWKLPGIGQFQAYDKYLKNEYQSYAVKMGHAEWANLPPAYALSYDDTPKSSAFFNNSKYNNGSASNYGAFFLTWYSNRLLQHASVILGQAQSIIRTYSPNVTLAAKIGCIYWQSEDPSHAAELTAGYKNYTIIANLLADYGVTLNFGCFDLDDKTIGRLTGSHAGPQKLISDVLGAATQAGLSMEGTNNLIDYSSNYDTIEKNCRSHLSTLVGFNFRYLSESLLDNLRTFRSFVDAMAHPSELK